MRRGSQRPAGEARERHVHVVGRAAHQANGLLGNALQADVPAQDVLARARDHVAHIDRLARLGVGHQALARELVLMVEQTRQEVRRAGERGMRRDVAHALAIYPDLAVVLQPGEKLRAGSCGH